MYLCVEMNKHCRKI